MIVFENVYECMQSDTLGQRKVKPSTTNNYPYTAAISYYDKEGGKVCVHVLCTLAPPTVYTWTMPPISQQATQVLTLHYLTVQQIKVRLSKGVIYYQGGREGGGGSQGDGYLPRWMQTNPQLATKRSTIIISATAQKSTDICMLNTEAIHIQRNISTSPSIWLLQLQMHTATSAGGAGGTGGHWHVLYWTTLPSCVHTCQLPW